MLTIEDRRAKYQRMAEGLEGVVATTTRLSDVDGEAGRLTIAGYAVEDLAPYASFEEVARSVEATSLRLLRERKPDRRIDTNVEFYTALLLHGLGLPSDLFTPTFAIGRVVGWSAHCLEQLRDGRLIRPQSAYVGTTERHFDRVDRGHASAST